MEQLRKDFIANVLHELKTPLTSFKGFSETLLDGAIENKAHAQHFVSILHREVERLQGMVESLLDMRDDECVIHIKDEGIGIPPEHIERIFERFYRVDASRNQQSGGRGIGLSIVKQIIKQHGGRITIKSTVQVGTTLSIYFNSYQDV